MRHLSNNEKTKYNTYSFLLVPYSSAMIDLGEEEPDYGAIDSIHYKGGQLLSKSMWITAANTTVMVIN